MIDDTSTPYEIVEALLNQSRKSGQPLGDVVIASHGRPDATLYIEENDYPLNSPAVQYEFARLHGHFQPGSRITFSGCEMGTGDTAIQTLKQLAIITGTKIRAHTGIAYAGFSPDAIGPYVEVSPVEKVTPAYGYQWW